jgi:hypothetical protein
LSDECRAVEEHRRIKAEFDEARLTYPASGGSLTKKRAAADSGSTTRDGSRPMTPTEPASVANSSTGAQLEAEPAISNVPIIGSKRKDKGKARVPAQRKGRTKAKKRVIQVESEEDNFHTGSETDEDEWNSDGIEDDNDSEGDPPRRLGGRRSGRLAGKLRLVDSDSDLDHTVPSPPNAVSGEVSTIAAPIPSAPVLVTFPSVPASVNMSHVEVNHTSDLQPVPPARPILTSTMAISSASVGFPAIPISTSDEVDGTTDLQPTPPVILTTISQLQQIGVDELLEQAANVSAFSYICWCCAETTASSVSRNFRGKQLILS